MIILLRVVLLVVVAVVLFAVWIYFRQDSMIYYPRAYRPDHLALVPQRAVKLEYNISCGSQTAYYVPPRSGGAVPERIWVLFGGNGSLALFWGDVVEAAPDDRAGFLMFDYPGYGHCEGKPSPASMEESGDAALKELARHLEMTDEELLGRPVRLLGHSLGAAVAMAFAERHQVDRVVLVAPFTTMRKMADRTVSPWLGWLLRHNFDNIKALETLAAREPGPRVIVTHGTADQVIPVEMSRQMARQFPRTVGYVEVKGADHESILDGVERYLEPELPAVVGGPVEGRVETNVERGLMAATEQAGENISP